MRIWYGLSDRVCEDMVNENLSFMKFCGLKLENNVLDHTSINRFRTLLTEKQAFKSLLEEINFQLENLGILVKEGCKMDANITESERKPKKKTTYEITEDRKLDSINEEEIAKQMYDIQLIKKIEK